MSANPNEQLCLDHLKLPVLIEQDPGVPSTGNEEPFLKVIRDQLRGLINQLEAPSLELVKQLIKRQRILVIVDSFSEMGDSTRAYILSAINDIPVNALILTSRTNESLADLPRTILKPLRIRGNKLAGFMESYLTHVGKREVFDDEEFFDACRRLSSIVGDRDITALLAKLYVDQLLRAQEGVSSDNLPDNILELMLFYLNDINRGATSVEPNNATVHRAGQIIAWQSLKKTFRPMPAHLDDALDALGGAESGMRLVKYLEQKLKILQIVGVGQDRLRFSLDPLAEYLAALHVINKNRENEDLWRGFLSESDAKDGAPGAIKSFLLAIRDCCLTNDDDVSTPTFVIDELEKRAAPTTYNRENARTERRMRKLIKELKSIDPEDRRDAAKALGDMKKEAAAAVTALIEALGDKSNLVRSTTAHALGKIGSESKKALPVLLELLNDEDEDVRSNAAFSLLIIERAKMAEVAIPVLIRTLKHPDENFRDAAHSVLRGLGPEVKGAVPKLTALLSHADGDVRVGAAYALGRIGPEAAPSIPALIELFKDGEKIGRIRSAACNALERIGPIAISQLVKAVSSPDVLMRLGAVYVLGRFGSEAASATPALVVALQDQNEDVRLGAASALVKVPGQRLKEALPRLIRLLSHAQATTRWAAAIVLGSLGSAGAPAIPTLVQLLVDEDESVRSGAAEALEKLGWSNPQS
jgi:HEAT repeat protein